jgi:hypothetical protein
VKKEISEPKYLEAACQSLISTKSDPQTRKLDTNSSTPKNESMNFLVPFTQIHSINLKNLHKTLSTSHKNAENMGKISLTPLSLNLTN